MAVHPLAEIAIRQTEIISLVRTRKRLLLQALHREIARLKCTSR